MGFNNWEELNNFNFDQLEENDVEYWLPKIVEIDVKDENDPQRLRALFNMSKALLEEYDNDLLLLREEIRELTEQNQQLSKEYNNLNAEIIHEKDLVSKRDELLINLREYQRRLDTENESSMSAKQMITEKLEKKLRSRNREMTQMLKEINTLTETNDSLENQVLNLKTNLEECAQQMEMAADECMRLKSVNEELEILVDKLQFENAEMRDQLGSQLNKKDHGMENELTETIDKKINEWKELEERDKQIQYLKNELKEATIEIESNVLLVQDLQAELNADGKNPKRSRIRQIELQTQLRKLESKFQDARQTVEEQENIIRSKEQEFAELLVRMQQYERGEYGLEEAVKNVTTLKKRLNSKEMHLQDLVQHCNQIEIALSECLSENQQLREQFHLSPRKPLNVELRYASKVDAEKDNSLSVVLKKEKYHCINCEKAALLKDANQQMMIRVAQLECENQRLMSNAQIVQSEQNEQNLNDQEDRTKSKTEVIENQSKIESKQTKQECEIKDDQLGNFERFLKIYQAKYETLRHQQGLLYQDYGNKCEKFEKEKHRLEFELEKCQIEMEKCNIKCSELESTSIIFIFKLLNESLTKANNTDDLKKRLTETIRNQIITRIESMISKRKLEIARSLIRHLLQIDMAEDGKALQEYESFISRVSENLQLNMLPKNNGSVEINSDYLSVQLQPEDEQEHFDISLFEDETEPPNSDETRNSKEATLISSCTEFQDSEENALIESLMEQKLYYEKMATSLELEVAQLREAVENLQTKTDQNMTIGNLHREIVDLKLKNASTEFKAAEATERLRTCETEIAKLKINLKEKRITVEKVKTEYKRKFLAMQKLTRILEAKFSLSEAENRLKIQEACTGQLLQAVQHKTELKQLLEWKEDIQRLKINNFILKRQNDRTVHEIDTKEKQIIALENTVDILTNDITLLQSKIEEAVLAFGKQMIQQTSMDKKITQDTVNDETNLHDYVKKLDEEIQILKRGLQNKEVQEVNGTVENQQQEEPLSAKSENFTENVDNANQKSASDNKANENDQKPELFDTMLSLVQEKIHEKETNYKNYGEKLQQLENQIEELKSQHGREMQSQQDIALDKLGEQVVQIKEEADRLFHFLENMKTIEMNVCRRFVFIPFEISCTDMQAKQTIELEELLKKKDNEIEKLLAEIQALKENESIAREKLKKSEEHLHENCLHSFSGKSPTREEDNEKSEILLEECESEISTAIESRAESIQPVYRVDDKKGSRAVVQERPKKQKSTAENTVISTAEHLKIKVDLENLRRRYMSLEAENKEENRENNKELLVLLQEEKRNLTMEMENQLKITSAKQRELDASMMNNKLLTNEIEILKCQLRKMDKTLQEQQTIKEDSEAKKQLQSDSHSTMNDKESEKFHKWEEQKKWQALLQKEKTKIEKKNEEINKLKIIEERMRDRIIRLEKRINYLENQQHDVEEQTVNSKRSDPYAKTAKTVKSKLTYGKNELSPQTCEANDGSLQKLEKQIEELQERLDDKIESEKTQLCMIKQLEATVQELQNNNAHAQPMMMSNHKIERKGSMINEDTSAYEEEKDTVGKDESNKLNWSVVKHEIKVTKQYSASDADNKNMVNVSAKKGVLYPWLCGEGYSSLLAQLTAENARLRTKLIRSENELKNVWKKFDHFRYAEDKVAQTAPATVLTSQVGFFTNNNVKYQTDDRRSTAEPAKLKKRCKHLEVLLIRETENNRRQILENERLKRKVLVLEAALTYDENNEKYVIQQLK
ncbi:putative septum site-determining protein MinC [Trichinella spiralis]|uniref:putative septum site-determining protein MinC n=1 Tax=Trichinella spiralis TaxID=6334 RepID=UPI0001EFD11B|nr:putative septum site-determining protein MinC [Trichinella spiralis]